MRMGPAESFPAGVTKEPSPCYIDGISGWEVPDRDQARLIFNARGSIGGLTHDSYLCDNSGYKCFRVAAGVNNFSASNTPTSDTALRPVATVTIAKE